MHRRLLIDRSSKGFTIGELLIVIVVIAILAAVVFISYNNLQSRARDTARQSDIRQVHKLIELYYAEHGHYPITTPAGVMGDGIAIGWQTDGIDLATDANCHVGMQTAEWVPDLDVPLPQSIPNTGKGAIGNSNPIDHQGCYVYMSDGERYILSAWNNVESGPQTDTMYRRLGFREMRYFNTGGVIFVCNHDGWIGGFTEIEPGVEQREYVLRRDHYKHSYTISNITTCNETPPVGA